MSEAPAPIPSQEVIQPKVDAIAAREVQTLAYSALDTRSAELVKEYDSLSTEERQAKMPSGSPEASLITYHKLGNLKEGRMNPPNELKGSPLVLHREGTNMDTFKGEHSTSFQVTTINGAHMVNGELHIECSLIQTETEETKNGVGRETIPSISIPARLIQNAQAISAETAILADPKLTESQKKLIQLNNKAKTDGAENVDYSTAKPIIKEVAESQGKLLTEPLVQVLTIHKNQPLAEGATPEQQLRHQKKMEKIDRALEQIQGSTLATPEGYAAVFSALGPSDIENAIASADATLATDRMTLKNLESQNPPNQQLIAEQKTKIQQEEASQEQRKKSLELFNDREKLTKYISSIQSGEMKPEVAKKINDLMAQGDFRGGVAAMVENKFNQLDDETKKKVLEGLKKFGKNIATYGAAGLAIALMVMIVEGLKPQQ